ncbi:hypothetical protein P3T76_014313 [Phytophthora citrophthora]|uniref:Uncharacterized protein n=1 Tax=Phytophthora citrophthora TaxID=4793 RepID=A0AAD9G174_9STRA|nr:hypothetical protein P3T76_014313 [Phytophthora citrophthora]
MELQTTLSSDETAVAAAKRSEQKRIKHREYVKKSYKKKVTTLENLRRELDALDRQYAAMLLSGSGNNQPDDADNSSTLTAVNTQSPQMEKYLQVSELKKWYQQENNRLYQLNAAHMKVEGRMGQLLDSSDPVESPLSEGPSSSQYHFRPLSTEAYSKVVNDTTNDVLQFARSPEKLSTGACVLGWTDQREVHDRTLKFALQKQFSLPPRDLLQRSWSIFSTPDEFSKIYGSALNVRFHVLQHIDADTILFYRYITTPTDSTRVVKTVFLLARRPIEEGYLLLFKSIDKDLVHFEEADGNPDISSDPSEALELVSSELWVDKYIWVLFYNVPNDPKSCLFHFGGNATTSLWLREVLFIAVRWESMAVGSQFSLTAE